MRNLPHSEECERAVLAAILIDPSRLDAVSGDLRQGDYYVPRHQLIYGAMLDLHREGVTPDIRTVQARLDALGVSDAAGGLAYLSGLDVDLPDLSRVSAYVDVVRDRAIRREAIQVFREGVQDAAGDLTAEEIIGRARAKLDRLELDHGRLQDLRPLDAERYMREVLESPPGEVVGLSSGLPDLDKKTQGFCGGQLWVFGGRPGGGKSTLGMNIADHVALSRGGRVAMFSLEMTRREIAQRFVSSNARIEHWRIRAGLLDQSWKEEAMDTSRELDAAPILLCDESGITVEKLRSMVYIAHSANPLSLVIVDYLQLMRSTDRFERRDLEVGHYARSLKHIAMDLDIPVLALSQLRRASEMHKDKVPQLSDLRESGDIENDADGVVLIHRKEDAEYGDLIVAKNRGGAMGKIPFHFDGAKLRFTCVRDYREHAA